jgi:hypothetical protein
VGVVINSRGATKAQAGVATTQSTGLMDLGAPLAESPLRTTTTMTLPTMAGNMEGGAIRTGADSVTRNTRHAACPSLTQKGISTTEVEGKDNLCLSDSEYEACRMSIFNPEGYLNNGGRGGGQPMPPAPTAWHGQLGMGQPTAAHPQGPQGLYLNNGGRGGGQPTMPPAPPMWQGTQAMGLPTAAHTQGLPGQYGLPAAPGPPGGGALAPLAATTLLAPGNQHGRAPLAPGTQQGGAPLAPQAPGTQQGRAQITVQPPGGGSAGPPQAPTGIGANAPSTQDSPGISGSLERLAPYMTNVDTSRSLRWQRNVNGGATKLAAWKVEATALPGLQLYAYMQPGEAFLVVGHTLSTIYSTTTVRITTAR